MTSKQISQNEFIAQAVAEAARVAIQTMATTGMARQENAEIKMSGPILKQPTFNWKAEDKQLIVTLTKAEQNVFDDEKAYLRPSIKFKPQCNYTIKSLQFHKLVCQSNESVEEWMGRLRTAAVDWKCKEVNRQLREQFIHGLNDKEMLVERELTSARKMLLSSVKLFWHGLKE